VLKGFAFVRRRAANGTMFDRFVIQYRHAGKQPKITLDAAKVSLTQARDEARRVLAQVELGIDPQADEKAKRAEAQRMTFGAAVELYLSAKSETLRPSSLRLAKMYLTGARYFPFQKPVADVTLSDVSVRLDIISRDSGSPSANRARARLSAFFLWCLQRGHVTENPVINTEVPKSKSERERVLSDDELKAIWNACGDDDYGRIIHLLLLTGCRRQEIGSLRWSEVDLNKGTLTIAAERSKNAKPHVLALPAMALDILRSVKRAPGRDYVFGSGFKIWGYGKARLDERLGGASFQPWVIHDLRRTFATQQADVIKTAPHVVEALLNHTARKTKVERTYNRATYDAERAEALELWAAHVAAIVSGHTQTNVVPLRLAG
jgi:integrase